MSRIKIDKAYYLSNIIFYICIFLICAFDYINYNGYIWGIITVVLVMSFLISALPDVLINLDYEIEQRRVKCSILCKLACLIIILGIGSYLDAKYNLIVFAVCAVLGLYDFYLFPKIWEDIEEDIQMQEVIRRMDRLVTNEHEQIYNLLYKSLIILVIYISLVEEISFFNIVTSIAILVFEVYMANKIKNEIRKVYPENAKRANKLFVLFVINVCIVIVLTLCSIKLFFSCLLIGLNWMLVSDCILSKKTSLKNF